MSMLAIGAFGWFVESAGALNPFAHPDGTEPEVAWPPGLPPMLVGLTDSSEPPVLRSETDVGPAKVRRRATRERRIVRVPLCLNGEQKAAFDAFRLSLAATGERFLWETPDTDEAVACRVTEWPELVLKIPAKEGGKRIWEGEMGIEVL